MYLALCSLDASCQRFSNIFSSSIIDPPKRALPETSITGSASLIMQIYV
ncbi:hypothetical protein HMPREF1383_02157 [Enterococcus faecium V689]|uniref:Uncharacterized protein n=1 Tax=Enterococcus faecium SD2A-2 TaxID=1244154 RepID=A0AB73A7R6_ENTFC|nr:hypothetical protein HMPREF1383_02157 [Enterococcus faecium V689]EJX54433.1 hypothetical protein HMPREF1377_02535 [Enterococcus faecium R494]EJY09871.1 hypothetical protein HMPREF1359_02436 [Enterococcus faecium E417]EJY25419.1 hypothetical protein HMPREF1354_02979 [Enterococcus faecium 514]EJY31283.1 hypothetical protein HMPREF1352_02888 [Enterococcus faecium 511]EJY50559.1 hypothetical protein HMPREF1349_00193 [Enterococcus faecium 506]EPI10602.1 hypothetical protein D356_02038 [Enteroco